MQAENVPRCSTAAVPDRETDYARGKIMKRTGLALIIVLCVLLFTCKKNQGSDFHCPGRSFTFGTHSYCAYREYVTWHEAKKRCADTGGYLLAVNTREENEALWETVSNPWEHSFWIGLSDAAVEGMWQWLSNEPVKYGNWRAGAPDNYRPPDGREDEDCAEWLTEDGTWNDVPCSARKTFLCKSIAGRKGGFKCTGKFFSIGEYEYCAYRSWVDWHRARNVCEVNGGFLTSIVSSEENEALVRQLGSSWGYTGNLWIGFSDETKEGNFQWTSGEPVTFGNWCTGEPNSGGKGEEDCAHMYTTRNCWNDYDCGARFGFICESGDGNL